MRLLFIRPELVSGQIQPQHQPEHTMTLITHRSAWAIALLLATTAALANDAIIGYVKTAQGDASVVAAGLSTQAMPGTPVKTSHILRTGPQASMGITLTDSTLLSIGPDTELVIDEYLYDPAQDDLKIAASLIKGSLNYVSGVIAKLKPTAVSVRTPTGNIGVRGTHFVAKVEPE